MKKISTLFFVFVAFMFFGTMHVSALGTEENNSVFHREGSELEVSIADLPYTYTSGEYSYTIEGLELELYNYYDLEYADAFAGIEPDYVIPITDSSVTIEPEAAISDNVYGDSSSSDGTFVNLNINLDNDMIDDLITEYLLSTDDFDYFADEGYIVFVNVKYRFTDMPEELHGFKIGFLNFLSLQAMGITPESPEEEAELFDFISEKIVLNDENSQFVDFYFYNINDGLLKPGSIEDTVIFTTMMAQFEGVIFFDASSWTDLLYQHPGGFYEGAFASKMFVFHNVSYLTDYIEDNSNGDVTFNPVESVISSVNSNQGEEFLDEAKDVLYVDVPDTALNIDSLFYISGLLILVIGGAIIGISIFHKRKLKS